MPFVTNWVDDEATPPDTTNPRLVNVVEHMGGKRPGIIVKDNPDGTADIAVLHGPKDNPFPGALTLLENVPHVSPSEYPQDKDNKTKDETNEIREWLTNHAVHFHELSESVKV